MSERIAYVNGKLVPESQASVSILDRGFLYGESVYDASRTFNGVPWRLRTHIERLYESCRYANLDPGISLDEMEAITNDLIERNRAGYGDDEFRINHWVTRGGGLSYDPALNASGPTVVAFTLPIDYQRFAHGYREGVASIVAKVRRTPPECVNPNAKVGNKMNHMQAELEGKAAGAWAIMLDIHGFMAEGPSYNCFFVKDGELLTSTLRNCLGGVNRTFVLELARSAGIPVREVDLTHDALLVMDEAFHTGNTLCALPVASIDGKRLSGGAPGPITTRLIDAWIEAVGCDWKTKALDALPPARD